MENHTALDVWGRQVSSCRLRGDNESVAQTPHSIIIQIMKCQNNIYLPGLVRDIFSNKLKLVVKICTGTFKK